MDDSAYKGVNFLPVSPQQVEYTVSHDIKKSKMRRVGNLFPDPEDVEESPLQQEILQSSKTLKAAANKAVVRTASDDVL